jgi:Ca2+-binding EF-hand superfamily protein/CRP-like cAMP-binding protein
MPAPTVARRQLQPTVVRAATSAISMLDADGLRQRHLQQLRLAAGQYRKHMMVDVKTTGQGLGRPVTRERKPVVLPPDPPPKSARADFARRSRPPPRRTERAGSSSARERTVVEPQLLGRSLERPQSASEEPEGQQPALPRQRPWSGRRGVLPQDQMMKMMVGVNDLDSDAREGAMSTKARVTHGGHGAHAPQNERVRASAPAAINLVGADQTAARRVDWMVVEKSLQQDLEKLLELLRTQRDSGEEFDASLLAAFRHCFQRLIDKFRAYRPLMSILKDVYDSHLDGWSALLLDQRTREKETNARLSEADAVGSQMSTESAKEYEHLSKLLKVARQKKQEAEAQRLARAKELAAAQAKRFALRAQIIELEENQDVLRAGGRRKDHELAKETQRLDVEFGASWAVRDRRDTILKNKRLAEMGLADCERLLRLRKHELSDTIKEREKWESEKKSLLHERQVTADEIESLGDKIGDIEAKLGNLARGRGDRTPRPDWQEAEDLFNVLNNEDTSKSLAVQVTDQIRTLRSELKSVLEELAASRSAEAARAAAGEDDGGRDGGQNEDSGLKWFVCRGTGPSVPKFLRATGKVRNRRWTKIKVEELIEEFWSKKILHDARHDTAPISVPDFFHDFLKQKVGTPQLVIEWGYNVADACRRYERDADVEIFARCLFGDLPEATYHGQMKMISEIQETSKLLDRKQHGGRTTDTLDRTAFNAMLKEMFAHKSDDDMKTLQQALSYDQPLPVISYVKLFESDRVGDQGRFAETLRDQYVAEAQAVYPELENHLRSVVAEFADAFMPDTKFLMPAQHNAYVQDLVDMPFFKNLGENATAVILGGAELVEYSGGERIIGEGGQARWIFILVSGSATATMEMLPSYKKEYRTTGDFFGEQVMMKHEKFKEHAGVPKRRAATVVADEHGATCLLIRPGADVQEQLIAKNGRLFDKAQRDYDDLEQDFIATHGRPESVESSRTISPRHARIGLERFDPKMPEIERDRIMAVMFNVALGAPLSEQIEELMSTVMERVRTLTIPRFSKQLNTDSEEDKREKFLRSLPDEEREAIAVCFDELDHDFSGTLSKDEMAELLERTYGMKPSKAEVTRLMAAVDTSGDGAINLEEFIEAMATVPALQHAADVYKWRQTFNEYACPRLILKPGRASVLNE